MGVSGGGAGEATVDGVNGAIPVQEDCDRNTLNGLQPGESVDGQIRLSRPAVWLDFTPAEVPAEE